MAKTKIVYSDANTMGVNTILFTFDSLIDTDFGMMSLVLREYLDPEVFSEDFFKKNDTIRDMVFALANREQENPLLLALKDNTDYDYADELYSELYYNKYKEILMCSMETAVCDLLALLRAESGVTIGIMIARKEEEYFLKEMGLCPKANFIDINNKEELHSIRMYNQIYFKSCNDRFITNQDVIENIYEKNIYIPRYPFNLDENQEIFLTLGVLELDMNRCQFLKYDIYAFDEEEETEDGSKLE